MSTTFNPAHPGESHRGTLTAEGWTVTNAAEHDQNIHDATGSELQHDRHIQKPTIS